MRCETLVKVKSRHFRRAKCLESVALDIWSVKRNFAISFVNSTFVWVAKVIAAWKFSRPSAERIRSALELTLLIADERYRETALAYANWLVTLFSALHCGTLCVHRSVDRYQNYPGIFRSSVSKCFGHKVSSETAPSGKGSRSDPPSKLGFALAPRENGSDTLSDTLERGKSRRTDLCHGH